MEFFEMGGYAKYLWPSYAVTFIAIVLNIIWAKRSLARAQSEALKRLAMSGDPMPQPTAGERA